jgi:CheY-like chemotaxis protein
MNQQHVKKAFIIDDDEAINFVTKKLLANFDKDCEVTTFSKPMEALEKLKKIVAASEPLPDVLLLDINMPMMNGFEFLQKMREEGLNKKVQVIMYTSSVNPDDKKQSAGYENVIGYMEKPFSAQAYGKILEMTYNR